MLSLFIVELVDCFQRAAIDQAWEEAWLVRGKCCQHVDPHIDGGKERAIKGSGCWINRVNDLNHIEIPPGHNANLINGGAGLSRKHQQPKLAQRDFLMFERSFPDRPQFKDQQVAAKRLVLVRGRGEGGL